MAGEGIKLTAKVTNKSKTNKGLQFEGQEGWFSVPEKLIPFSEKINKGDTVEVTFIKTGVSKNVVYLSATTAEAKKEEQPSGCTTQTASTPIKGTGFNCTVCGAELKDGKYKKCFNCNKKAKEAPVAEKKEEPTTTTGTQVFDEPQKETTTRWIPGKSNYGSPEDIAGKEVGCAANCAAAILAGRPEDPETLLELWRTLFNGILEHIKLNK